MSNIPNINDAIDTHNYYVKYKNFNGQELLDSDYLIDNNACKLFFKEEEKMNSFYNFYQNIYDGLNGVIARQYSNIKTDPSSEYQFYFEY